MDIVTIEGSVTPCVELARGEQRTVPLTDRIQRLIDFGYVVVVGRSEEPEANSPGVEYEPTADEADDLDEQHRDEIDAAEADEPPAPRVGDSRRRPRK